MFNLNLLNPEQRSLLTATYQARQTLRWGIIAVIPVALLIIGTWLIDRQLSSRAASLEATLASQTLVSPTGQTLPVSQTTRRLNTRASLLAGVTVKPPLEESLSSLIDLTSNVSIESLSTSRLDGSVRLTGTAATRNDIPELEQTLKRATFLKDVSLTSNLNERTNVSFTVTAKLAL